MTAHLSRSDQNLLAETFKFQRSFFPLNELIVCKYIRRAQEKLFQHSSKVKNIKYFIKPTSINNMFRSVDMDMSKECLLKRLGDLLSQEKNQLTDNLLRRKQQLQD